ncbi:MAG: RecB family exonuclease [Gemmatimonadaceae bacterium]
MADRRLEELAPSAPSPTAIGRLSPSLSEALRACALQAAFMRDGEFDVLRRPSTASALGLTCHDLTEAVSSGDFNSLKGTALEDALKQAWDAGIEGHYRELQAAWPLGTVPAPERWPGYGPTRRRLLRALAAQANAQARRTRAPSGRVLVEQLLEPEDIPLHGRADRVEREAGETRIVDLKSGSSRPPELRPVHRRQLLIYCYLWHALHGEWPKEAAIQRLDGSRMTLEVDPAEAKAIAETLLEQREGFNSSVEGPGSVWELGSPSPESCQYCDFKGVCPAFLASTREAWGWYRRHVLGIVSEVARMDSITRLDIAVEAGNLSPDIDRAGVVGVPVDIAPLKGARVAVVDALPTPVPSELRVGWDSHLCTWS